MAERSDTDPRSSCHGKTPYPSPQAARRPAKRMGGVRVYHCHFCGNWHIGNSSGARRRRR